MPVTCKIQSQKVITLSLGVLYCFALFTADAEAASHHHKSNHHHSGTTAHASSRGTKSTAGPKLMSLTPHADTLQSVSKVGDHDTLELLRFGALKHSQGRFDEAETAFRQVIARDPNNVDAFYDLGSLAERRGDLIAALSHYRAAQALKPSDHQISDAVHSVEKTLRSAPFAHNYLHPDFSSAGEGKQTAVPLAQTNQFPFPPLAPALTAAGQNVHGQGAGDSLAVEQNGVDGNEPVLSVVNGIDPVPSKIGTPGADTFQLSSSKNAAVAPTLGVVPASGGALPASPPVVGVARSHPLARAAINGVLNTGTSFGLRAVGLHCPICHFVRFNF